MPCVPLCTRQWQQVPRQETVHTTCPIAGHRLEVQKNTALMHKVLERGPHVPGAGQSHNKVEEDDVDDEGCSMLPFGCFLFWKYPHVGQGKAGSSANKRCTNKRNRPSRCRGGGHVE